MYVSTNVERTAFLIPHIRREIAFCMHSARPAYRLLLRVSFYERNMIISAFPRIAQFYIKANMAPDEAAASFFPRFMWTV